ncbi:MAG: hypothetical protein SGI88_17845 [Candidatus Hydrogenedentes bacterium]|nr:hypothetical protein [Candidatus Hydrogenedentota bacterium]
MPPLTYVKPQSISLKSHPDVNERWLQQRIIDDTSILGLGDLLVKDVEIRQPRAGRLDLLLIDPESERWYEVEIQLGETDASHIIRTLEYWDIQRKRYPQYDHCAVLVAENVTSRFLNVIGLFNSTLPIFAIQLSALQVEDKIVLNFVKVLDEVLRGDEDLGGEQPWGQGADRAYWEKSSGAEMLPLIDQCFGILRESRPGLTMRYNKQYIGQYEDGLPNHCVKFRPSKQWVRAAVRVEKKEPWVEKLKTTTIERMAEVKSPRLVLRLRQEDLARNGEFLRNLFSESCRKSNGDEE